MAIRVVNAYNHLSGLMEIKEQTRYDRQSHVAGIDKVMREAVGLRCDLVCCELELVETLVEGGSAADLPRLIQEKLATIRDNHVQSYATVLESRGAYMEGKVAVDLTEKKRKELLDIFSAGLDQSLQAFQTNLQAFQTNLSINPQANLQERRSQLIGQKTESIETYTQMLESKVPLTVEAEELAKQQYELKCKQHALMTPEMNSSVAAQLGNVAYLSDRFDKKWLWGWLWGKKDFFTDFDGDGFCLLHLAAKAAQLETVTWILEKGAPPNVCDREGYQPLHYASKVGTVPVAQALIQARASVNGRGEYGRTPLHMAAYNGKNEVLEILIQNGADVNLRTEPDDGEKTALHDAVMQKRLGAVTTLIKSLALDANIRDKLGFTVLRHAVLDGSLEIATLIVGHRSWKCPADPTDPNHTQQLVALAHDRNFLELKGLLESLPGSP